jgi:hypothetical protein
VEFTCDALPLRPDTYYLGAVVRDASTRHVVDWWDGGTMLHVTSGPSVSGQFFVLHSWCVRHDRQFQQALVP